MIYAKGDHPPVAIFGKGDIQIGRCREPMYIERGMYQMVFTFGNVKTETGEVDPGSQPEQPPDLIFAFDSPESIGTLIGILKSGQKIFAEYLQQSNTEEDENDTG